MMSFFQLKWDSNTHISLIAHRPAQLAIPTLHFWQTGTNWFLNYNYMQFGVTFSKGERKKANITSNVCCFLLTVGGHEETSVDLFGVAEVWLNLLPAAFKLPLVDATGFDVQHKETGLPVKQQECVVLCFVCPLLDSSVQNANTDKDLGNILKFFICWWETLYSSVNNRDEDDTRFEEILILREKKETLNLN